MYTSRLIGVVAIGIREGRCKFCRDRIFWVTTASSKGSPSRTLPFSYRPWPLRTDRNDDTGVHVEWWPSASRHRCTTKTTTAKLRASHQSDAGHDRIYRAVALE